VSNSLEANDQPHARAGRNAFVTLIAPPTHRAAIIWAASVGVVVVVVFGFVIRGTAFDLAVVQFFNGFHHGAVATVTDAIYKYVGPIFAIIGTAVLTVVIFVVTRNLRIASTFAVVIAVTWLSMALVKLLVHRVRPDEALLSYPFNPAQVDASYPSGHAAFITALVVTIFLAVTVGYRRWLVGILGGVVVAVVGLALVTDGVHYPSDVIGSVVWAITVAPLARMLWVGLVIREVDRYLTRRTRPARHAH